MTRYRTLTYDQVCYNAHLDCRRDSLEEGLDALHDEGWELVTAAPGRNYVGQKAAVPIFIFRKSGP